MKKFLVFAMVLFISSSANAAGLSVRLLKMATNDTVISSYPVYNGVSVTTDTVYTNGNTGFNVLIVDVAAGGDIDISQEVCAVDCSDEDNWYTPYTTDGSSLTAAGGVATAVTANRWIIPTARISKYVRFIIAPDADSTISMRYMYQQEQ